MKCDIIDDVHKITTLPTRTLEKLFEKIEWCICEAIQESSLQDDELTQLDIGIGILNIQVVDDTIRYKFTPNSKLEGSIKNTIINKKNPLVLKIEEALINRFAQTYKDMI